MPIRKSRVSGVVTSGTTADRPSGPSIGDTFFNGTLGVQEIYTSSGWLPATGANDFNIVLTGSETSVVLDKEYFSGAYTITSAANDTSFDLYLFNTANSPAGHTSTPSINATDNFNKVVIYGGTNNDLLSFSYKTTFTASASNADTFAAPYITSINAADLPNIDDSVTITGGNFHTDTQVWFDGQNGYSEQAKSIVYGSSTSIVATRPDSLLQDNSPYTIRLVKPGVPEASGTNINKITNAITAGGDPVWVTSAGALPLATLGQSYSTTLQATDPDGGAISYSIVSGQLLSGLSLNSSTGEISGTAGAGLRSFVIAATDSGGNAVNRSFSVFSDIATGGTVADIGGYRIHTFTASGTLNVLADVDIDYLVVAGGGAGGGRHSGGGGAGQVTYNSSYSISQGSYTVEVGAGGDAVYNQVGGDGSNSFFLESAIGGGGSGHYPSIPGRDGGSGGGGTHSNVAAGVSIKTTSLIGATTYGNNATTGDWGGGGGGATQAGGPGGTNNGGDGFQSSISGTSYYYGGGGGGSQWETTGGVAGNGGKGGGGGGGAGGSGATRGFGDKTYAMNQAEDGYLTATYSGPGSTKGGDGAINSGGGGGGCGQAQHASYTNTETNKGGHGGSGIVIVRYAI